MISNESSVFARWRSSKTGVQFCLPRTALSSCLFVLVSWSAVDFSSAQDRLTLPGPELVVLRIDLVGETSEPGSGIVRAEVKNAGSEGTGLPTGAMFDTVFYRDGLACAEVSSGELEGGEIIILSTYDCNPPVNGHFQIQVVVDVNSEVGETNEVNNSETAMLAWGALFVDGFELGSIDLWQ